MRSARMYAATLVWLIGSIGCGGSSDAAGPTGPSGNGTSHFRATIDGTRWASNAGVESTGVPVTLPGVYTLTGTQLGGAAPYTITLMLYDIGGPGTYPLGVGPSVPGGSALVSNASGGWVTPESGADGSILITALTDTRIAGTFNVTVNAATGSASGTKVVTLGDFDVPVHWTRAATPLPDNAGSKVTAQVGAASWNAAFVSSQLGGGQFIVASSNASGGVGISLANVNGPGTYVLSAASSRALSFSRSPDPLANTWSTSGAGGEGSVTIASVTATRIQGTFTGTLGPAPGTTTTGTVTLHGTFDLGRQ